MRTNCNGFNTRTVQLLLGQYHIALDDARKPVFFAHNLIAHVLGNHGQLPFFPEGDLKIGILNFVISGKFFISHRQQHFFDLPLVTNRTAIGPLRLSAKGLSAYLLGGRGKNQFFAWNTLGNQNQFVADTFFVCDKKGHGFIGNRIVRQSKVKDTQVFILLVNNDALARRDNVLNPPITTNGQPVLFLGRDIYGLMLFISTVNNLGRTDRLNLA